MKKKFLYPILKFSSFFLLVNLPFLTVSQLIGMDAFIDSFKHPDSIISIKSEKIPGMENEGGYIIIEQPSYQGFSIGEGDCILYQTKKDSLQQNIVSSIKSDEGRKMYYTTSYSDANEGPIYDQQIIGKIIGKSGDNLWVALCLEFWEASIDKLNILTFFSNK
jgi:hypothetical protein